MSQGGRDRVPVTQRDSASLELSLEATRREPANDDATGHGVGLQLRARW